MLFLLKQKQPCSSVCGDQLEECEIISDFFFFSKIGTVRTYDCPVNRSFGRALPDERMYTSILMFLKLVWNMSPTELLKCWWLAVVLHENFVIFFPCTASPCPGILRLLGHQASSCLGCWPVCLFIVPFLYAITDLLLFLETWKHQSYKEFSFSWLREQGVLLCCRCEICTTSLINCHS